MGLGPVPGGGQVRPLAVTGSVVSVTNAETPILLASKARRGALIQNFGASVVQIHFAPGQAFGAGPIQLQQYQTWEAAQLNGVYQGVVYGIRAAATADVGVTDEA